MPHTHKLHFLVVVETTVSDDTHAIDIMARMVLADSITHIKRHPCITSAEYKKAFAKCEDCLHK